MNTDLRAALRSTVRALVQEGNTDPQLFEGGQVEVSHEAANHFTIAVTFDNMSAPINAKLADAVVVDMRTLRLPRAPVAERLAVDVQFAYDTYMRQQQYK